jgi:hypothetical protein
MNLYQWERSNPVGLVDPSGLTVTIRIPADPAKDDKDQPIMGIVRGKLGTEGGGTKHDVPLYRVKCSNESGTSDSSYLVTRDTADDKANAGDQIPKDRRGKYGPNHEAPPGEYEGDFFDSDKLGKVINIHDPGKKDAASIDGPQGRRTVIHIHQGPGQSIGCLLGQEGKPGQEAFNAKIKALQDEDREGKKKDNIVIIIEDRNPKPKPNPK